MLFISYAQNFEDVMLWRALKHVNHGFYIDAGAAWPDTASVTKAFYDRGWRGINIEPNLEIWPLLAAARPRDINLKLALSDRRGQRELYVLDAGLSSLDRDVATLHEASGLQVRIDHTQVSTLSDVWREHVGSQDVHFLKIDVEGGERQVLLGNDWSRNRPWLVVIEATVPLSQVESHDHWESIILNSDYRMAYKDGLNRFYVAAEHQELLSAFSSPPNVFDGFVLAGQFDAESRARVANESVEVADARAQAVDVRAHRTEARLQEAEARANTAEALGQEAEARASAAEALGQEAEERASSAEARANVAKALGQEAEERASSAEARANVAEAFGQEAEERASSAEARAHYAEARARSAEALAQTAEARAHVAEANAHQARAQVQEVKAQAQKAKARLAKMRSTISWQITKPIRAIAKPISRHLEKRLVGRWIGRRLLPQRLFRLYHQAILYGRPWGFSSHAAPRKLTFRERVVRFLVVRLSAKGRAAQRNAAAPLSGQAELVELATLLGKPGSTPDTQQMKAISSALRALDRHSEQCLLSRKFSPVERQAMLELEFALHLAMAHTRYARERPPISSSASDQSPIFVFDARCCQDASFRDRGVGIHARQVLAALSSVARPAGKIVLLLDPTMDSVDDEVAALCDQQVFSCAGIDLSRVKLFVSASPMTASIGRVMPLLIAPYIRRAAVVYDFIPAEFPSSYLRSAVDCMSYQARHIALQAYHAFLPISGATEIELRKRLTFSDSALIANSGVADPLLAASGRESEKARDLPERYIMAPTGGDPRKNLLIVIAAEALNRSRGKKPNHIVIVGHLTKDQQKFVLRLRRRSGLTDADIVFLSGVSSRDLKSIYRRALICVVPSFAEGFSIPAAEAVHCGTAVVASDIPAHRELLGAGPWLALPSSVTDMARAVRATIRARQRIVQLQKGNLGDRAAPNAVHVRIANLLRRLLTVPATGADEYAEPLAREVNRPRIAVATPWPPQRSGVADYSHYTMEGVSASADVTILTNERSIRDTSTDDNRIPIREIGASAYLDPQYDRVLTILGNSHFHLPGLEYVMNLGGPILVHDNRMVEFYWHLFGLKRTARLLSTTDDIVQESDIQPLLLDLDRLPSLGYAEIGRIAKPLLVHSKSLQDRLSAETEANVMKIPFVPYRRPEVDTIDHEVRLAARRRQAVDESVVNIATFGIVDRRTKGADLLVDAMAWLALWRVPARLHYVGAAPSIERSFLDDLAAEKGVQDLLIFHDHMDHNEYSDMLLAADIAVQLRMSSVLTISGALLDCIAFGVPTIATQSMVVDASAPPFVTAIPDRISPLLLAEAITANAKRRGTASEEIECQRLAYLADYSPERYAAALLESLGVVARAAS